MAQEVSAVVTDVWRTKLAKIYAGIDSFSAPLSFSIGEGGWQDPGGGKEPIPPDATITEITAPSYPSGSQYHFFKDLAGGDVTFTSPTRLEIRCFVGAADANDDGSGAAPEFFEIGIYDATGGHAGVGTLLVYSTFPIEIKTASKALEHVIFVDF